MLLRLDPAAGSMPLRDDLPIANQCVGVDWRCRHVRFYGQPSMGRDRGSTALRRVAQLNSVVSQLRQINPGVGVVH